MKRNLLKAAALILAMICILCCRVPASAAGQGTEGTELQVMVPQNLEIQLGQSWTGVEFQLKTDVGMYPGVITVGEDGVLKLEIGGSENYILSCLNSGTSIPVREETIQAEAWTEQPTEPTEGTEPEVTLDVDDVVAVETQPKGSEEGTVAGIPAAHIALFGGGLVVAIGILVGIQICQKRSGKGRNENDDDDI